MPKRRETVKRVIDGDSFTTSVRKRPVRLASVRAPEANTPRGRQATQHLKGLIDGQKVNLHILARDIYGRAVASVKIDGKSINAAMSNYLESQV